MKIKPKPLFDVNAGISVNRQTKSDNESNNVDNQKGNDIMNNNVITNNNKVEIFNNPEFGEIRTIEIDNEPWFVGKDVAEALGYTNTKDALAKHVDNEDKNITPICEVANHDPTSKARKTQNMTVINESGLYSLIMSSKLPTAKQFKRWVTSEVLPSIRKTGTYALPQMSTIELIAQIANNAVETERRLKAIEAENNAIIDKQKQLESQTEQVIDIFTAPQEESWRQTVVSQIQMLCHTFNLNYKDTWNVLYEELEKVARCDLKKRQLNKQQRMSYTGSTKSQIAKDTSKLALIEDDTRLKAIFDTLIRKLRLKYIKNNKN